MFRGNRRFQALGRLKKGERNKTESAYEDILKDQLEAGDILWYGFETHTFKLADDLRYTPDFNVLTKDYVMEHHEVKPEGYILDDAKAKWKVAGEIIPYVFRMCLRRKKKNGGGWLIKEYGSDKESIIPDSGRTPQPQVRSGGGAGRKGRGQKGRGKAQETAEHVNEVQPGTSADNQGSP